MANRIVLNPVSYHGKGALENILPELNARGCRKAFVCTDPDLVKFGVVAKVTDLLDAAGFAYEVFCDVKANPTIENVQAGVEAFKACGADCKAKQEKQLEYGGGKDRAHDGKAIPKEEQAYQ